MPAAYVGSTLDKLVPLLDEGDTVIDGGNSWYHLDVDRSKALTPQGIHYLDVGTSGGVHGLARGYCLMIGGDAEAVKKLTRDDLVRILSQTDASLIKQYTALMATEGLTLDFTDDALREIAGMAMERETGVRSLRAGSSLRTSNARCARKTSKPPPATSNPATSTTRCASTAPSARRKISPASSLRKAKAISSASAMSPASSAGRKMTARPSAATANR